MDHPPKIDAAVEMLSTIIKWFTPLAVHASDDASIVIELLERAKDRLESADWPQQDSWPTKIGAPGSHS